MGNNYFMRLSIWIFNSFADFYRASAFFCIDFWFIEILMKGL